MTNFKPCDYVFEDEPYLLTAGSEFGGVYVALHPFRQLQCNFEDPIWRSTEKVGVENTDAPTERFARSYEKCNVTEVLWQSIIDDCGFSSPRDVQSAYSTYYNRLISKHMRPDLLDILTRSCVATKTCFPEEDCLPASFEQRMAIIFRMLSIDTFVSRTQFAHDFTEHRVVELENPLVSFLRDRDLRNCIFSPNHEVISITLINNIYTLLALSQDAIEKVDLSEFFEGFWAVESTSEGWAWAAEQIEGEVGTILKPKWHVVGGQLFRSSQPK